MKEKSIKEKSFRQLFEEAERHDDYWVSGLILDFTQDLYRLMKEKNIKKTELAKKIGTSPAYITKVLRGDANFTLKTMFRLARAVGGNLRIQVASSEIETQWTGERASVTVFAPAFSAVVVHSATGRTAVGWATQSVSGPKEFIVPLKPIDPLPGEGKTANYAYATA